MHMQQFWSEWDGRGSDDAVACTVGWVEEPDEARREIRRLGIDIRHVALVHGWAGYVDGDIILDACDEDGQCLASDDQCVDAASLFKITFAFTVVQSVQR